MADQQSIRLGREVERLVTAPYAPSLQVLQGLVETTTSNSIQLWAFHKPCQIGALVDVLVDGLSRSRFALPLLRTFVLIPAVRNVLLERYPCLLDQLLQTAIEDNRFEYASVCTAILSSPLPPDFLIPACLAPFMEKSIRAMGESPCAESILPLNQICNGIRNSPGILLEIPSETMSSLQVELTKTLRNLSDHMGNILCLATFARMASLQDLNAEEGCVRFVPSWLQNVNHFFGPKRGLKTLDLVFLRVILACSDSCNDLTVDQAAESIRLAIEICDRVEQGQRECWITANSSKIAKLREKVTRNGIDRSVQLLGVTFLASLVPDIALSPEIARVALEGLLSEDSTFVLQVLPSDYVPRLVGASVSCLGQSAIRNMLEYIVSTLTKENLTSSQSPSHVQVAKCLVAGLCNAALESFPSMIVEPLDQCKQFMGQIMNSFPRQPSCSQCNGSQMCEASLSQLENELIYDFYSFYIHASLLRNTAHKSSPEIDSLQMFMARYKQLLPAPKCSFSEIEPVRTVKTLPSPDAREGSQGLGSRSDWRSVITETLMLNARMSNDNLLHKIGEVCYDLEQRCDNVEVPLRAVEQERDAAMLETQQVKNQNSTLGSQLQQASDTITALQLDISRLETHAEAAFIRAEELSATLDAARKDLEIQKRESQDMVASEREMARTRELDLVASITERDDQLEALQEEITDQKAETMNVQKALDEIAREKSSLLEQNASLSQDVMGVEEKLKHCQILLTRKDEDTQKLLSDKDDKEREVEALRIKLDEEVSKSNGLASALEKAEEDLQQERETVKDYRTRLSVATAKYAKQTEEISSLQMTMQAAASDAAKDLQTKEKRIHQLEKKVQQLRDERAAKAREFSEAQQHIGRLMNVMGFRAEPDSSRPPSKPSRTRPCQTTTTQQTQPAGDEFQTQPENQVRDSFGTNLSPPGSRSPKRSRERAFPGADSSSQQMMTDKRSRDSTPRPRRTPLEDTDQNSQPYSQRGTASPRSEGGASAKDRASGSLEENQLRQIDLDMDLEFSKNFLFTSTSLSPPNDHMPFSEMQ
ncbi:hypothetical protein BO94DRAFT_567803 [Aspergillus sclerotioniger CBS 115572]|uniref:Uncharacterized protein n=1 Tax=Aspergillus sclerotioniger CBS 115572 TaxID=1450535 RepID=A0A317W1J9_9EURO|nr:hypothetical protein BO94DRAFT_567803 [Aspergillus sclerotioniger CBS 115572]PWY79481.1 hypothetical protein BO94DRAFT_567803 [Aspergillus sclerotioniger CBS 115572]